MNLIPAKTIVSSYSAEGWFGSNYNMNIYKGCCHGCIYCDSRSECYQIEDFDTVRAKENALQVIERDLRSKRKSGIVITGSMSDPYNPLEKELQLTRGALRLIDRYGFGFVADTKSTLVLRDIELLQAVQKHSPVAVNFTVTTANDELCRKIEQSVSTSGERFAALEELAVSGIPCGVLLMPILPFINDSEENIRRIVARSHDSGARWIYAGPGFGVTLRQNQREYFLHKLDALFPGSRKEYERKFGHAYSCVSPRSERLWQVFRSECTRLGLIYSMKEISTYIRSQKVIQQISLF